LVATLSAVAIAQANPLDDLRRDSSAATSSLARPIVAPVRGSVVAIPAVGSITVDTPSARLIAAGVRSGDPVIVDFGTQSVRAYAAFADELARSARYYAEVQKPAPADDGFTVVINRDNPTQPVVLSSNTSDGTMYVPIQMGYRVTFHLVNRSTTARTD
jgi:hypothetical protein